MRLAQSKTAFSAWVALAALGIAAPATADKDHKGWVPIQSISQPILKPDSAGQAPAPSAFGNPAPAAQAPAPVKNQSMFRKSTGSEAVPPTPAGPPAMQPLGGNAPAGAKGGGVTEQPEMVYKTIKIESPPGPRPLATPGQPPAAGDMPTDSMSLNYDKITRGTKPPAGAPGSVKAPNKDPQGAAVPAVQSAREPPPKPPAK